MRRRISALALTAALAGGVVFTALPATTASAATTGTCHPSQMRQQIADLRAKAKRMKHEGEPEAARRATAQADAIQKRLNQCIKSDNEASKPWS
ncbi:hypothetical protein AB0K89_07535 [Streptomyces cinnamoneus]|uniref:hypothetical protein n=1 Tax=Streptomyces cinnamoneus TaxID=53446 RepID=UPI00342EBF69